MASPYLGADENHPTRVRALFDKIASRYDLINDVQSLGLHRMWKRRLIALAAVRPGDRALDVCCGTGDIAFRLAQSGAEVTGLDFSQPMLEVAQRRAAASSAPPQFMHGDALHLPFADASFDVVTCGYGLRNLADWQAGLREMHRVVRPGGRLLVLDFAKPANPVWRALYFGYLRFAVPIFGQIFCGDSAAYSYILESLRRYPAQAGVAGAMSELGCADVRVKELLGGVMSINSGAKAK